MTQRYHLFFFSGAIREEKFNLMLIHRMEHFFLSLFCFEKWTVWLVGVRACVSDCPSVKNRSWWKFLILGGVHVLLNANCSWNHLLPNLRVRHNHWQLRPLFCVGPYLDCIFLLSDPWSILLTSDNSLGKRRLYIQCRIILDIYFRQRILTFRMQNKRT